LCKKLELYFDKTVNYWEYFSCLTSYSAILNEIFCTFDPKKLEPADYLIICGDLGLDNFYDKVYNDIKEKTKHLFKDVFYIKGNHDYWQHKGYSIQLDGDNNINLHHRYVENVIDDYVFLGCTMWSPIKIHTYDVRRAMNDYRYIPNCGVETTTRLHEEESEWLRNKVHYYKSTGKKIIVFTHHVPRQELINRKYLNSTYNEAYYVMDHSCDDIKPDVWCTGHAHTYHDKNIDGVRFVCNPIGYRSHYGYIPSEVYPEHWYNTVIEI
jgi:predicted phosphodiesterase